MNNIVEKIIELKKKRDALILAHNYQPAEIQDIADFTGDSLDLSRKAALVEAKTIIFCGVRFMAETASILCPDKKVLLPDASAGCPMADMIDVKKLRELKNNNPGAAVVCYVNTSAAVKAESDICCTSSNAVKAVASVKNREIIFVPDRNLGRYAAEQAGRKLILADGYCPVHMKITAQSVKNAKKKYPLVQVLAHPECAQDTLKLADKALSTNGMINYAKESAAKQFIIATETGILHRLKKENPGKEFYPAAENALCADMKRITLEKILRALEDMKNEIKVPRETALKARKAIDRMLEI